MHKLGFLVGNFVNLASRESLNCRYYLVRLLTKNHGCTWTAIPSDCLCYHGDTHVVLAPPTQVFRHDQAEKTKGCQRIDALLRKLVSAV